MSLSQLIAIAMRQTLDPGDGLSAFLSRLSILGLAIAVALLLAVMSVMNGFDREMRERILYFVPHVTIRGAATDPEWQRLVEKISDDPAIVEVQPFFDSDALVIQGREARALRLLGIDGDVSRYERVLSQPMQNLARGDILLGGALSSELGLRSGDRLTLLAPQEGGAATSAYRPMRFTIRAVLDTGTEIDQQLAVASREDVAALAGSAQQINGLAIRLEDVFTASSWRWRVSQSLPAWYFVTDWTLSHGNLYAAIRLSRQLILLLMATIIAVAAFNVVSSLVLVVTDRSRSIAMLRAVGIRRRDVMLIYLLQGMVIGALGAMAGSVGGAALAHSAPLLAEAFGRWQGSPLLNTDVYPLGFVPVALRVTDFLLVSATSVLLSVMAAVIPAWQAARLPVAATLNR